MYWIAKPSQEDPRIAHEMIPGPETAWDNCLSLLITFTKKREWEMEWNNIICFSFTCRLPEGILVGEIYLQVFNILYAYFERCLIESVRDWVRIATFPNIMTSQASGTLILVTVVQYSWKSLDWGKLGYGSRSLMGDLNNSQFHCPSQLKMMGFDSLTASGGHRWLHFFWLNSSWKLGQLQLLCEFVWIGIFNSQLYYHKQCPFA